MLPSFPLLRPLRFLRPHTIQAATIVFVLLVVVSFLGLQGWSLYEAREKDIETARIATGNMTRALAQHTDDTIRAAEVTLIGVVHHLEAQGADLDSLARLHTVLRQTVEKGLGLDSLSAYDSRGRGLITSRLHLTGTFDIADRDYFKYHASNADREIHIGTPVRSRTSGHWILPVSRRINKPNGSFGGVAVATIELAYFQEFHNSFDIGRDGAIALMSGTGRIILRRPFTEAQINMDNSSGSVFQTYLAKGKEGSAVLTARFDGIARMYTYQQLTHYPLIIASALALTDVLQNWRHDTIRIVAVETALLILLCMLGYRLVRLIGERERAQIELRKAKIRLEKMNRSLEKLTLQDSLTGLGNRRLFDTALIDEFQRARRAGTPLALLMIDVDYFKRYNDLYGHPAGDECLRQLGETLAESGCRPGDVAVRYGGEELAVLLPNTDEDGAFAMGERFRLAVLARAITHAGNPQAVITVSIGAAACRPGQDGPSSEALVDAADKALYAAKGAGRNQVRQVA
jgi:diguanylate cyclase (GGDEF)-like protein